MAKVKKFVFKNPDVVLRVSGIGEVTPGNLTNELHASLLRVDPVYADFFEEKEIEEVPLFINPKKKIIEPKSNKNGANV